MTQAVSAEHEITNPLCRSLAELTRTKTVATLGPVSSNREMLVQLIEAGVDIFRLNMAHANRDLHQQAMDDIRWASHAASREVGVLVDLAGPKIRLGQMPTEPIMIETGSQVRFVREATADPRDLTCSYENLIEEVNVGDPIMLCDGTVRLEVLSKDSGQVYCQVVDGGEIRSRQGVNLPGANLSVSAISEIDWSNAMWAAEAGADFISLSFVRSPAEVLELKNKVREAGSRAMIISKIEKREALDDIENIVDASDGIMVARGDLGVEIEIEKTPAAQKRIIRVCQRMGKPVIVATQMLESMRYSKRPTRAEATDVANAILDGADACMLSGETAIGEYPLDAVRTMQRIMWETEQTLAGRPSRISDMKLPASARVTEAIVRGAALVASQIEARLVAIATKTGEAALIKSKQRDFIPTLALTDDPETLRRMNIFWGVQPLFVKLCDSTKVLPYVQKWIRDDPSVVDGQTLVFVIDTELWPGVNDMILVSELGAAL